ncbi:beta-lactamase-like protein 2 homolog [Onthophagus taurus]|uniref:beta-lactamase-like protein 2 homolog n=1 Tax=Onthophagus taurus TaxID=166361 RepID=UPI0039BE6EBC
MAAVIPSVSRLSPRIIRVLGANPGPMTLQGTNTYIIGTGKRRILLDTGDADVPQYINHLKSVLKQNGIDLAHIFISHWHHDHIGGVSDVMQIKEHTKYCQVWKYPRTDVKVEELPNNISFDFLKDGQEFEVEGATIRIVHTPGHTTDHVVLHLLEDNAVFSCDCILGEGTAVFEDLYDYMNSLESILDIQPSIIYPGHGNIIHEPIEKIQYYIDHRKQRENQIISVLTTEPKRKYTPMQLVEAIYIETPKELYLAAAYNVQHHLTKLVREKKVKEIDGNYQYIEQSKM